MYQIKKKTIKSTNLTFFQAGEKHTDIHFRPLHTEKKNVVAWVSVFGPTKKKYINVAKVRIAPGQSLSHTIHSHTSRWKSCMLDYSLHMNPAGFVGWVRIHMQKVITTWVVQRIMGKVLSADWHTQTRSRVQ